MSDLNYLKSVTLGSVERLKGNVDLRDYDPSWPSIFQKEKEKILDAIGERALSLEHVGSTSVPGLSAKPIIDILLLLEDSAKEDEYVPSLLSAGYELRIREEDWYEHRMLKKREPLVNLHVFSFGCEEAERMIAFRDHLRSNDDDRLLYEREKRRLSLINWEYVQEYADAKSEVVKDIFSRILN